VINARAEARTLQKRAHQPAKYLLHSKKAALSAFGTAVGDALRIASSMKQITGTPGMPIRHFASVVVTFVLCLAAAPLLGFSRDKQPPPPEPEERIPVAPLGYRPPGPLYMLSGKAFTSLDFIDAHHLLFTFRQPRLMRRDENPGGLDHDQVIQALTLQLPDGTVQASAEWRMHDRSRYIWPLGGGRFLVRQRNTFSLTDAALKLHPYIDVATRVLATEVSPDGRILVVQHQYEKHTPEEHARLEAQARQYGDPPPAEDTQITVMNIATREMLAALRTESPIHVPITSTGYVGVGKDKSDKNEDQFLIRFIPFEGQSLVLGRVASTCTPHEEFLSPAALMIESCGPRSPDLYLDVWTTQGKKLWSGQREGHLVWPTFAYSRTGGRFAVSLLRVNHFIDLIDSLNDEDVREQVVQVFDSATGALLMATTASPILTAGQNFALSEDGERLAVLREGAIEIYKVPPPPAAENPGAALAKKK
jgi:hypothetical protein